ncbi:hypothetical protein BC940DRAFT_320202 [Gongronella butleri]|nr:hypothetical protein BC940DRAFT_320202 [Gongronella butleri]
MASAGHDEPLQVYVGNHVRTAKYTPLTFVPKNLFEQFRNVANLYFLFLVILQCIPLFGVTEPAVSAMPLMAILLITAIKDGVEDWKRNQQDQSVNGAKTLTLSHWANVNVPPEPTGLRHLWHLFLGFFCMLAGLDNRYSHAYRLSRVQNAPVIHVDDNIPGIVAPDNVSTTTGLSMRSESIRRPSLLATQIGGQPVPLNRFRSRDAASILSSDSPLPQYLEPPPPLRSLPIPAPAKKVLTTVRNRSDTLRSEISNIFRSSLTPAHHHQQQQQHQQQHRAMDAQQEEHIEMPNEQDDASVASISDVSAPPSPIVQDVSPRQAKKSYRPGAIPHSVLYRTNTTASRQHLPQGLQQQQQPNDRLSTEHLRRPTLSMRDRTSSTPKIQCGDLLPTDAPAPACKTAWQVIQWQDVKVGDYVLLRSDDDVPADIIILSTSEKDSICCTETKNLDGETNLKVRQGLTATKDLLSVHDCERARFYVECEPPNPNIYRFNGVMRWQIDPHTMDDEPLAPEIDKKSENDDKLEDDADSSDNDSSVAGSPAASIRSASVQSIASDSTSAPSVSHEKTEAITHNNILLRGCVLRNTDWVIGLVVYTGDDTKIMLNSGKTPSKRSQISKQTNPFVIANFAILAVLCLVTSILASVFFERSGSPKYFNFGIEGASGTWLGFVTFWVALILYQNIVPISLYISVEIVKTFAAWFIYEDVDLYYEPTDQRCLPRTWNISDDLGQIQYVFSDKTGTLTQNVMEYRKCTINGVAYGLGDTEALRGAHLRDSAYHEKGTANEKPDDVNEDELSNEEMTKQREKMFALQAKLFRNPYVGKNPTFVDPKVFEDLGKKDDHATAIMHFFSTLALCHTVLVERNKDDDHRTSVDYKAQSPDEAALVATARDLGFTFLERDADLLMLNVMGENKAFELLNVLEFNSTRKRMSVILRPRDGTRRILLLCKGADSVIYERLCDDFGNQRDLEQKQKYIRDRTAAHLEAFAQEGLRTLCLSYRFIAEDEYNAWNQRFDKANSSLYGREEKLDAVCEEIECDMLLMGGTAIEDRLQEGVPETIAKLSHSGINLWVLTGDKTETAINIAYACNLITNDMDTVVLQADDRDLAMQQIKDAIRHQQDIEHAHENDHQRQKDVKRALVIDGKTLQYVLEPANKKLFLHLAMQCASVICCRVSPKQKAQVVALVKKGLKVMTLAVGDGANDVSMIQEANVGVGISGVEGRQAVMSSDYAIAQFRYLEKLLLVHGRWSYLRTAEMTIGFFFKNIIWTFVLFWYQIFCQFTGTMMYDYALVSLYNLVFTSLPIIALGIWDQDLNATTSLLYPELYRMGLRSDKFKTGRFWLTVLDGIYQSAVCFFFPYMLLLGGSPDVRGYDQNGMFEIGTIIASYSVFVANLFVAFCIYSFTWIQLAVIILSTVAFYIFTSIYAIFLQFDFHGQYILYGTGLYWLMLVLTVVACFVPRVVFKYDGHMYRPYDNDIIRERELILKNGRTQHHAELDPLHDPSQHHPST